MPLKRVRSQPSVVLPVGVRSLTYFDVTTMPVLTRTWVDH